MTSVYRLADETEEFSFIPSQNHNITAIETIRKRSIPQAKKSTSGNSIKSDNIIWETQQKSNKKTRRWN